MRLNLSAGIVCVLIAVGSEAATLTPKEDRYLRRHAVTLCAGPCRPGLDWSALQARLRGKRVVALGEFNHGSREIFEVRNDLIRSLARNGSLGALLFESGIGELAAIDGRMESLAPSELTGGFFGGWRTTEMQALMVFAQQARIPVAGFDVQRTARSFRRLLAEETQELGLGGSAFGVLEQRFDGIQQRLEDRQARYDALEAETLALVDAYRSARNRLVTSAGKPSTRRLLVVRTLDNRVTWLSYMLQFAKDKDWRQRWAARDAAMAENVVWLAENVYPDKTLVLIAHNFHAAKSNETESVMGAILRAKYRRGFYAIGMFAGSGSYANNSGKTVEMELPDASRLDLKEVIGTLRGHASLLLIPPGKSSGTAWLQAPIIVSDSFIDLENRDTLELAQHFDALVLLARVSPPSVVRDAVNSRSASPFFRLNMDAGSIPTASTNFGIRQRFTPHRIAGARQWPRVSPFASAPR